MTKGLKRFVSHSIILLTSFLLPVAANAFDMGQPRISGFLSAGATHNDNETEYQSYQHKTSFEQDSLLGLQFDGALGDGLRFSGQLLAFDDSGSYDIEPEWAYVAYSPHINWEIKAGLYRIPNFLYSETIHVGISYPWLRPPAEVYNLLETTRAHGLIATYSKNFDDATLYVKSYYGQRNNDSSYEGIDFSISAERICGINAVWQGNGYQFNISALNLAGDIAVYAGGPAIESEFDRRQFTIGFQKDFAKLFFIAEASKSNNLLDSNYKEEGAFVTFGYYLPKYTPYMTYAMRNSTARGDTPNTIMRDSESLSLGVSRQLNSITSVSAEWLTAKAKNDTAGLFGTKKTLSVNPGDDNDVNLISVRIDVVF